ncbi:porin [Pantoea agglomerans]|uniref:Porin n=1 Tax=Enterobacter agglomerans TaxID=549 RepID=A0ACC5PVN9_ENTAG|nr:porin [Pantoea agglomerans]MBD8129090.1 porin [Pantoea agglomerans]MBD8156410.1 porin [Pantoea agglomerans]MBD8161175.1 porin [Pantoea agglomerans]MBD8234802.1 porin [Pantoea agglomerans]MBD8245206.1 porin [Pantoea agglomerans]
MKKFTVITLYLVLFSGMTASSIIYAAEIFNRDGNKIDLDGMVDARHQFSKNADDAGDQSYTRLGFRGETKISDRITGFSQWEYELKASSAEDSDGGTSYTRLGFAGLKLDDIYYLDYGRNYGILYDIGAWTDVLPVFGNDSYQDTDRFMTGRANNLLTLRNNNFFGFVDGLNFSLQFQGKNESAGENGAGREEAHQNGMGYGASLIWSNDSGINAGLAWADSQRTLLQKNDHQGNRAGALTAGMKYDANPILLAASYTHSNNLVHIDNYGWAKKADSWEVASQYTFDSGFQPGIAWVYTRGTSIGDGIGSLDLVNYIDFSLNYILNDNITTYADYKVNILHQHNRAEGSALLTPNDNAFGVGLVYQF